MIETSEQINELATALAKAQAAFTAVPKGKTARVYSKRTNSEYSYKYADLADAWDVARAPLADNGLSVVQCPVSPDRGVISVVTLLIHTSGQWIKSVLTMEAADATPQSIGTIITYARRYGLASMLGLVTDEDTDAQGHEQRQAPQQARTQPSQERRPASNGQAKSTPPLPAEREKLLKRLRETYKAAVNAGADVKAPTAEEVAGWSDALVRGAIETFEAAAEDARKAA